MPDLTRTAPRRAPRLLAVPLVAALLAAPALAVEGAKGTSRKAAAPAATAERDSPAAGPEEAPAPEDVKRVVHLPESVKAQLREEIKQEVLEQARREGWAAPGAAPSWTKRLKFTGDVRSRFENVDFKDGNDNTGGFPDFNAINTNKPFDLRGVDLANDRYLNVDKDRSRFRLRARLGLDADLGEDFTAGLRFASGDGNTPVSTNQTLGGAPGNFSKYQFWLDRAFVRYGRVDRQVDGIAAEIGRFENPFLSTDLVWDDDVNFDGAAVLGKVGLGAGVRGFATLGAFPLYSTALNFPPEQTAKFSSFDKWLWAAQAGAGWRLGDFLDLQLAGAFYYFFHVEGRTSTPCDTQLSSVTCNTDESRPLFAQKGNTYMPLRTPSEAALVAEASGGPEYQFFGLASRFRVIAATARVGVALAPQLRLGIDGEYVRNVAFSRKRLEAVGLNNRGAAPAGQEIGPFRGGNAGYLGRLTLGSPVQHGRWSWNVSFAYRYLETDAVVDAFTDSDFGLGGTNLKGFVAGGTLGLADAVTVGVRWMSADQVAGPKYAVDLLQADLSARF